VAKEDALDLASVLCHLEIGERYDFEEVEKNKSGEKEKTPSGVFSFL